MSRTAAPQPDGSWYEMRVQGRLDDRWATRLDGMAVTPQGDRTTLIRGPVVDQAALHGLLAQLRDLNVPLISLARVDPGPNHSEASTPTSPAPVAPEAASGGRHTLAITQTVYGTPEALTVARVPRPVAAAGEVLVEVHAASVNARDWHIMRGEPRLARLLDPATFGRRGPRTPTRGTDLAGIVVAVGEGVRRWKAGDRVFGEGTGTFAQHAVARADQLAALPASTDFDVAATVPLAATTASLCIDAAEPAAGNTILINGASGGVGTFALQLATAKGLRATAVVSTRNVPLAERLGADRVIDYTADSVVGEDTYDVVVDLVGNLGLRDLRRLVRPGGALVLSGGGVSGKGRIIGPLKLLVWAQLHSRFSGISLYTPQAVPRTEGLEELAALIDAGTVTPVIDRRFDLTHTPDAIAYVEREHARAKVVITTQPERGHAHVTE